MPINVNTSGLSPAEGSFNEHISRVTDCAIFLVPISPRAMESA